MSMQYVRKTYGVPAKRGRLVCYAGRMGKIVSADHYVRVKLDDLYLQNKVISVHPTDDISYLLDDGQWVHTTSSIRTLTACKIYSESLEY